MSSPGQISTDLKLVTIGDFDPQSDRGIEFDFIGRVIAGRYTIRAQIGGGGMADVFRATDEELGVDVAIKLLKPRMASDELRARMVQEAQAAAQVRHANLVRVFGTGKLDSTAYIAMELLAGPNLEQYLRERADGRLPWREALALLLPALAALHAVHERGYVHRDIKPGNILVTHEPGRGPTAIVIDLGLVKADRALRCAASPPTTEVGRMLCTPGYTSPEQAAGLSVDRRSDVYSMAVTLYRVLAGRPPFSDARGKPVMVVLAKHIYNEPTMLAVAAAGAEIPAELARVVESALHKNPAGRPQTMLAFAEALRAAVGEAPVGREARARRRPHEFLLAIGFGVTLGWLATAGRSPPDDSIAGLDRARCADLEPAGAEVQAEGVSPAAGLEPPPLMADPEMVRVEEASEGELRGPRIPAPTRRARDPEAALHQALARRTAEIQRCADQYTSGVERLAIEVKIDGGGLLSAHVVGAEASLVSRCVDGSLKQIHHDMRRLPATLVHTFHLQATPRRP